MNGELRHLLRAFRLGMIVLALTACGKEPQSMTGETDEEALQISDGLLMEQFQSTPGHGAVTSIDPAAPPQAKLQELRSRVSQFVQSARVGFQACKADISTKAPNLLQGKPQNLQEGKAKLSAILSFFQTNQASLSPACQQWIGQLKAFREKVRQRLQSHSVGAPL